MNFFQFYTVGHKNVPANFCSYLHQFTQWTDDVSTLLAGWDVVATSVTCYSTLSQRRPVDVEMPPYSRRHLNVVFIARIQRILNAQNYYLAIA